MSYSKVDHDRFSYLVLLAVLPTIGHARWGDKKTLSERAGWAMNLTQIAVVSTYFFSSWAKLRFGGIAWLNGATLTRAVVRRGTSISDWTLHVPHLLQAMQWLIVAFELCGPVVLFVRSKRVQYFIIAIFYGFHLMVFGAVTIIFLPHLVAMTSFLPLERVRPIVWLRNKIAGGGHQLQRGAEPDSDATTSPSPDATSLDVITQDPKAEEPQKVRST